MGSRHVGDRSARRTGTQDSPKPKLPLHLRGRCGGDVSTELEERGAGIHQARGRRHLGATLGENGKRRVQRDGVDRRGGRFAKKTTGESVIEANTRDQDSEAAPN